MRTLNSFYRWSASLIIVLLTTCSVFAQARPTPSELANGSIHIVAVMVEFQEDDNRFTSGNGRFNPSFLDRPDITIDPLPHDRGYFEAHLLFAKNYFERVSGGKLELTYEVLPQIITVPEEMAAYSPLGDDGTENIKLAFFARDVWEEVDRQGLLAGRNLDPERTMYIAFHAGVGRDLELIGTTLFKTPQDIPSVFLSQQSLQRLFENPVFDGFNVNGNIVRNTAILPETQSRPGENIIGEEFVLELSINGILTATIGSFLGLPDLFNTDTGASGIGRFGLMDGAGFFSYFGLFPPEPSAWEKYWLGWVSPIDITQQVATSSTITVTAPTRNTEGTVARLPISSDEYFLVENRIRDPFNEGLELTIRRPDGVLETVTIPRDETRFAHNDLSRVREILPAGVLVDVSHFDWSLPGGLDIGEDRVAGTDDDRFLNGGILIWHIDDQIIRSRIADNAINNDPRRKGVKLVEADAAQDIGRPAGGVTQYDQGAPFDFWWAGNDFTVITQTGQRIVLYQNRFGDDTRPNNRSNSGARTYFEFLNFSDNQIDATFDTRPVTAAALYTPVSLPMNRSQRQLGQDTNRGMPLSVTTFTTPTDTVLIVPLEDGVFSVNLSLGDTLFIPAGSTAMQPLRTATGMIAGGETVHGLVWDTVTRQFESSWQRSGLSAGRILSRNLSQSGSVEVAGTPLVLDTQTGNLLQSRSSDTQTSSFDGITPNGEISGDAIRNRDQQILFTIPDQERDGSRLYLASMAEAGSAATSAFLLITDERFLVLDATSGEIRSETPAQALGWPYLFDWSGDGLADILYVNHANGQLEARNQRGAMLDGFPVQLSDDRSFTGSPLVLSSPEGRLLMVPSTDGFSYSIQLFTGDNLRNASETLLIGATRQGASLIQPALLNSVLYAVSPGGDIRMWRVDARYGEATAYVYGRPEDNLMGRSTAGHTPQPGERLLVQAETYNWPNPASTETHVRFMTTEAAEVTITIISYSGMQRYTSTQQSRGRQPVDVLVNTSNWSNGVYFARVTARSDGTTEHKVITMVVAR